MKCESLEPVIAHFIDADPKEALMMMAFTAATPMVNLLLSKDEGLSILTLLSAILFGAELVTGSDTKPYFKLKTNHKNIQSDYPLRNITAALWVNLQEEAAMLRTRIEETMQSHKVNSKPTPPE